MVDTGVSEQLLLQSLAPYPINGRHVSGTFRHLNVAGTDRRARTWRPKFFGRMTHGDKVPENERIWHPCPADGPLVSAGRDGGSRGGIIGVMTDVTQILSQIESGDPSAAEQLLPLVYEELRKLAAAKLVQEKPGQTLQATSLVHEAYLRLVDVEKVQHWDSPRSFFCGRRRGDAANSGRAGPQALPSRGRPGIADFSRRAGIGRIVSERTYAAAERRFGEARNPQRRGRSNREAAVLRWVDHETGGRCPGPSVANCRAPLDLRSCLASP